MAIPEEFFIVRQGRRMVLYAGLLGEAHARGLKGIDTELLQVPVAENGNVAVVKATVEMAGGQGQEGRTFSGIGDASPENVGRGIVPHIIRMAETRAKARALRDAVNIGVTALEEMGEDDAPTPARETARANVASAAANGDGVPQGPGLSEKQEKKLLHELDRGGYTVGQFEEKNGPIAELTKAKASWFIDRLVETREGKDG